MTSHRRTGANRSQRGSSLVEFAVVALLLFVTMCAVVDICRMVLVYTAVANASRIAARYACVHGSTRTGTGSYGPSGPADNPAEVIAVARNYARAGLMDTSRLIITVQYPDASNTVGSRVNVTVVYPYDPLVVTLPLRVRLESTSQGVVAL